MNPDDRVRQALHHHAERIQPADGSRERIQERVDEARRRRRHRWAAGTTGAVAAAVLLAMTVVSFVGGDDARVVETGPAATSVPTAPPAVPPPPDGPPPTSDLGAPTVVPGIWPLHTVADLDAYRESGDTRYDDPAEVARAFAVEYLGMEDPVVGEPDGPHPAGDHTVIVQPRGEGGQRLPPGIMETVVYLDPAGGPPWQVLATVATNIHLDGSRYLRNAVTSPIAVSGRATAHEGTVQVAVREAGMEAGEALGRGFATAGTLGDLAPFAADIAFDRPTAGGRGALMLYTESAVDGSTLEATVTGLTFGGNAATLAPPSVAPGQTAVTVFFHRSEEELVPVTRLVPATAGVLRTSLEQLLAGPTDEEQVNGLSSWFSRETEGMLNGVTLGAGGTAVVDLDDLRPIIPNASTSAGSMQLLGQLNATVFQFPTVTSVDYRINGSCEAFFEWLQRGCEVVERPGGG